MSGTDEHSGSEIDDIVEEEYAGGSDSEIEKEPKLEVAVDTETEEIKTPHDVTVVSETIVDSGADSTTVYPPLPKAAKKKQQKKKAKREAKLKTPASALPPRPKSAEFLPKVSAPAPNFLFDMKPVFPDPTKPQLFPTMPSVAVMEQSSATHVASPAPQVPHQTFVPNLCADVPSSGPGFFKTQAPRTQFPRAFADEEFRGAKALCYTFSFPSKEEMDYIERVVTYFPDFTPHSAIYFADAIAALISNGITLNSLVHILRNKLESNPACQYWVRNLMMPPGPKDTHEVLKSFRDRFIPDPSDARRKLEKLHQGNWNVLQYLDRFMETAIHAGVTPREMLRMYVDGLTDDVRFHVKARGPRDLREASTFASEFEEGERRRAAVVASLAPPQQHQGAPPAPAHHQARQHHDDNKRHRARDDPAVRVNFMTVRPTEEDREFTLDKFSSRKNPENECPSVQAVKTKVPQYPARMPQF